MGKKQDKARQALQDFLASIGWKKDAWGNYRKDDMRYKFNSIKVRHERKTTFGTWVRIVSGYYRDIQIINGQIIGMVR